ncbi:MAG TPA: HEAT repeat domain-containing protein [Armatimonadota bacterium]|nr:HEAT repeat domain-containing protein [Armatimonadota bacterium]
MVAVLAGGALFGAGWRFARASRSPAIVSTLRAIMTLKPINPGPASQSVRVVPGAILPLNLAGAHPGALFSLTLAAREPDQLRQAAVLRATLRVNGQEVDSKPLHQADPDVYLVFRALGPSPRAVISFDGQVNGTAALFDVGLRSVKSRQKDVVIEAEPNDTWQQAQTVPLGGTVIGTADDRPYLIAPGQNEAESLAAGADWFKFVQPDKTPKLVDFNLDILDRDVPANILVFTPGKSGKLTPYTEGVDPVSGPHESQVGPTMNENGVTLNSGNKFTTRVLRQGVYYVQVSANHPAYRLRTIVHEPPPYTDPHRAIRTAMDYIIAAGDSWFANTPRSGAVDRRDIEVHAETADCVACHTSHFATRGELWAYQAGYPVRQRESLRFIAERLYNNPRPFYGVPSSSWVRVISAAATVQSRMAQMLLSYEKITGEHRAAFYPPINTYLRAYFQRAAFQPDETEQNPPSISDFETGWMVWSELNQLAHGRPALLSERDKVAALMASASHMPDEKLVRSLTGPEAVHPAAEKRPAAYQAPAPHYPTPSGHGVAAVKTAPDMEKTPEIKNQDDLCFQVIALASMDRARFAPRIQTDVARIFALQRPDGLWAYNLPADQPECEFQTGEALYALAKAGVPLTDPHVQKAVKILLARQKPFGAWNTDGQPYEAFNTPFKETQLVLMGLAAYYPGPGAHGWTNGRQRKVIRTGSVDATLADLIAVWDPPAPALLGQIRGLAHSPEPLVRCEALNALCRLADPGSVSIMAAALGDDTNMVRRAAAQGIREIITCRAGTRAAAQAAQLLLAAMRSPEARTRRGALRVFSQHFRWLASHTDLLDGVLAVVKRDHDPVARMEAAQSLYSWWYWNDDPKARGMILDTLLAELGDESASPMVQGALKQSLYNVCDDDIQYFYNFWTALLPQEKDRKIAIDRFQNVMALEGDKIAAALEKGTPFQVRQIVTGLSAYPIMRTWKADSQISRNFLRIGNDLDAIDFRGPGAVAMRTALLKLLQSPSPVVRQRALVITSYLRSNGGQPILANEIASLIADTNPDVRSLAYQAHRIFPFNSQQAQYGLDPRKFTDENNPNYNADTIPLLTRLLTTPRVATQAGALRMLAEFGDKLKPSPEILETARNLAIGDDPDGQAAAFEVAGDLPALRSDPEFRTAIARVLASGKAGDPGRTAAVRLALNPDFAGVQAVARALESLIQSKTDESDLLALARSDETIRDDPRLIPLYENALSQDNDQRLQALSLLNKSKAQAGNPAIRVQLQTVAENGSAGQKVLASRILSGNTGRRGDPEKLLDQEYFAVKIEPLLAAKGPDGRSCFDCHGNHTILNLQPPDASGQFSAEVSRHNYLSALRVVDLENPENSLILRKPRSPGFVSPKTGVSHVGGVRWTSRENPAYQAILAWLNGAHVKQGAALGKQ